MTPERAHRIASRTLSVLVTLGVLAILAVLFVGAWGFHRLLHWMGGM